MEESHIDSNNNIISKKYDKAGQIASESKITPDDIMGMADLAQIHHEEQDVPVIKSTLQTLSTAAESYAKAHNGSYPVQMKNLTEANPPYIDQDYCGKDIQMYFFKCDLSPEGYTFTAKSLWPQYESYVIKTGGLLETKYLKDNNSKAQGK